MDFFDKMKRLISCKDGVHVHHCGGHTTMDVDEVTRGIRQYHLTLWAFKCLTNDNIDIIADVRTSTGGTYQERVRFATADEIDAYADKGVLTTIGYW